jgi:hypothetical protein
MNRGYVRLYRKVLDSVVWQDMEIWRMFSYLLLKVTHKPHQHGEGKRLVSLKPGQCIIGRKRASVDTGLTERRVRGALDYLRRAGVITTKTTNRFTRVTLLGWPEHNPSDNKSGQLDDQLDDQQTTSKRPADDHIQTHKHIESTKHMCVPPSANAAGESTSKPDQKKKAPEYTPEFEQFWALYPRKVEKRRAFNAWRARIREGATPDQLILAGKNYAQRCTQKQTEQKFIKHPATLLNPDWKDWLKPQKEETRSEPMGEFEREWRSQGFDSESDYMEYQYNGVDRRKQKGAAT